MTLVYKPCRRCRKTFARQRGCCLRCYKFYAARVKDGRTTWARLEAQGKTSPAADKSRLKDHLYRWLFRARRVQS